MVISRCQLCKQTQNSIILHEKTAASSGQKSTISLIFLPICFFRAALLFVIIFAGSLKKKFRILRRDMSIPSCISFIPLEELCTRLYDVHLHKILSNASHPLHNDLLHAILMTGHVLPSTSYRHVKISLRTRLFLLRVNSHLSKAGRD